MKGIATTLVIIVTAIVILVAALVVLTIFGGGMQPIVDITSQQSLCMTQYSTVCVTGGQEPPTWNARMRISISGGTYLCSCADLVDCRDCATKQPKCEVKPQTCTLAA